MQLDDVVVLSESYFMRTRFTSQVKNLIRYNHTVQTFILFIPQTKNDVIIRGRLICQALSNFRKHKTPHKDLIDSILDTIRGQQRL